MHADSPVEELSDRARDLLLDCEAELVLMSVHMSTWFEKMAYKGGPMTLSDYVRLLSLRALGSEYAQFAHQIR